MKLVESNKNKIDRGPTIEPSTKFTMDQLPKKEDEKSQVETTNSPFIYEPKPTTLKINTKLRDQINTLSLIGYGDTQKEVVELLINSIIDSMTIDEKRKFDYQYQVIEDKTIKMIANKK